MRGSAMRESVTDVRIILECLQEAYGEFLGFISIAFGIIGER